MDCPGHLSILLCVFHQYNLKRKIWRSIFDVVLAALDRVYSRCVVEGLKTLTFKQGKLLSTVRRFRNPSALLELPPPALVLRIGDEVRSVEEARCR